MKNILVTGGAGFLGSHTCLLLLQNGFNIVVLDSFINSSEIVFDRLKKLYKFTEGKLKVFKCDIRDNGPIKHIWETLKMVQNWCSDHADWNQFLNQLVIL